MILYISMAVCVVVGIVLGWHSMEFLLGFLVCICYDVAQSCYAIAKRTRRWEEKNEGKK